MTRAAVAALALLVAGCRHPNKVMGPGAAEAGQVQEKRGEPTRAQKSIPPKGEHPRVPSSPKALLAEGEIGLIQEALVGRGYLEKHSKGELDGATTSAIRKFQRDLGLAETGFPDRLTLQKLGIDPEAAYGKVREGRDAAERGQTGQGSAGSGGSPRQRRSPPSPCARRNAASQLWTNVPCGAAAFPSLRAIRR